MKDRLITHLRALIGERHPISSPRKLLETEIYLRHSLTDAGCEVVLHPFDAFGHTFHNVVGVTYPSRHGERTHPPLLIAAHYDTVPGSPGADDNASALAVLLEVAGRLQPAVLRRPVYYIGFNLEEENLLGSRAYVASLKESGRSVLGAIVLECVGYARSEPGSQQAPSHLPIAIPSVGDFLGVIGNEASRDLVTAIMSCGSATVPSLKMIPLTVPGKGELLPDVRRSDHAAFWDEGWPAVMLTDTADFRNPHYHQPSDTIETLDLDFLSQMVPLVAAIAIRLAGDS